MSDELDKNVLLFTSINNWAIECFEDLEQLGLYTYIRFMIDHKTTTVPVIIDRLIEKFHVDHEYVMTALKLFDKEGLLMMVNNTD